MSSNSGSSHAGGIGLGGAVFIVFLVLKLTEVIDWSWWWVTAPLWIPAGVALLVLLIAGLVALARGGKSKGRAHGYRSGR